MMPGFKTPDITPLEQLIQRLGDKTQSLTMLTTSMESVNESFKVKRDSQVAIEMLTGAIDKTVNEFFEFSAVYREGNAEKFIENIKLLDSLLSNDGKKYVDNIRWTDDETAVTNLRKPVSNAYLALFNKGDPNRQVVSEDFWKCLDLAELRNDLYRTVNFQNIGSIFTGKDAFDKVNKLIEMVMELRVGIVSFSERYEKTILDVIDTLNKGVMVPITDTINFNAHQTRVLGNVVDATIPTIVNRKWYHNTLNTTIGAMATDTGMLLAEPLKACTPERTNNPKAVDTFFKFSTFKFVSGNINILQKEFVTIVDQISLSSKRLSKISDQLIDIPDQNNDGGYNYILRDIIILIEIYSQTLAEVLRFIVGAATQIEHSFTETNALADKVKTLRIAIDNYLAKRLKT